MRRQVRVLVVDSRDVFDIIEPVLRRELHADHITYCDSRDAAMAAISDRTKYDIIVADWEIAGECFVVAVRDSFTNQYSPIIVTTNFDNDELVGRVMRSGATGLIVKPFLEKGLVAKIRHITQSIEQRRHHRVDIRELLTVNAEIADQQDGVRTAPMQMVDISASGCRVKVAVSCGARIYSRVQLSFTFRDSDFALLGHLIRLEAEPELVKTGAEYIYASFVFSDVTEAMQQQLNQMLDELSEYKIPQPPAAVS